MNPRIYDGIQLFLAIASAGSAVTFLLDIINRFRKKDGKNISTLHIVIYIFGVFFVGLFAWSHFYTPVPNIIGLSPDAARQTLQERELTVSNQPSPHDNMLYVKSSSPSTVKPVRKGTEVTLILAKRTDQLLENLEEEEQEAPKILMEAFMHDNPIAKEGGLRGIWWRNDHTIRGVSIWGRVYWIPVSL